MAAIRFDHVSKAYADGRFAVSDLNLEIADGEFLVLVGPSGCGKSTALRMIAGLEDITAGSLFIGDKVANALSPRQRDVAMIFQSYALYPHLSVAENLGFGLKVRKQASDVVGRRVNETAALLELGALLARRPGQLSGGQRQRVAMGRALVRNPNAFLMDEPLSNLDARLRGQMRVEIARLQRAAGVTTVYVTHDQVEAMTMGDRVAVLRDGILQQLGAARVLYDRPVNLFVATFIGSPPLNLLAGVLRSAGDGIVLDMLGARIALPMSLTQSKVGLYPFLNKDVIVGVRSEAATLTHTKQGMFSGSVVFQEDLGATMLSTVDITPDGAGGPQSRGVVEDLAEADIPRVSNRMRLSAQRGPRLEIDEPVGVAIEAGRLLFFDPTTKLAID
jgi:multiple sugar transport system ATP-binding protein